MEKNMNEFQRWFADNGDKTHRLNYNLNEESVVFDIGGYHGDFAHDIYEKFNCSIYIFEPVKKFYKKIKERFKNNKKIKVFNYGLSDSDTTTEIDLANDKSSTHITLSSITETIELKKIDQVMSDHNIEFVDLIKINIEGGEFPLLKYIIMNKLSDRFKNIQVQFHTFVDFAAQKRKALQQKLSETHFLTYNYNFVWENWQIKNVNKEKKKSLYDYNDKHLGEAIYILGSSTSLNGLSERDLKFLENKTTIGVNFSYEAVKSITYAISAHITPAIYLFEKSKNNIPIFVDTGGQKKKAALSHIQNFFWEDERVVEFLSDTPAIPFLKKSTKENISLNGNTSILLLATHLARLMGAAKIIYIGFEELVRTHFWDEKEEIEDRMVKNIREILKSKKYWSGDSYSNKPLDIPHNIHKEFEELLGDSGRQGATFNLTKEEHNNSFYTSRGSSQQDFIKRRNRDFFSTYVSYLNSVGIETYTLSKEGITIESGCNMIKNLETL
tara:strand:- start:4601 stop:6094 length:1494 start_codon:yes stop_codon:yes gene_type:complete